MSSHILGFFDGYSITWLFGCCLLLTLHALGEFGAYGLLLAVTGFFSARLGSRLFPVLSCPFVSCPNLAPGAAIQSRNLGVFISWRS